MYNFPYFSDLATAIASAGACLPIDLVDRAVGASPLTETFTIAAVSGSVALKRQIPVPVDESDMTVTVGGSARLVVEHAPSSGQVQLDPFTGVLTFHSSDAGGSCTYTITPLATAMTRSLMGILESGLAPTPATNTIYIDKSGNDTTGNGSRALPFLTIAHAVSAIGTPSATNLYVLDIGPGVFDEAVVLTKSYVTIRGAGPDATIIRHDNPASASSGLYAGPLKIHSGTWGASHSGDTALAGIILRDITLKNQPTVDDGDVYPALTIGDPTRALYDSAITTPGAGIILQNVHLRGYRDTLTICGRADILIRDSDIRGTLDTIFPIGANLTLINTRVENTTSSANALIYACGTETLTLHGCLLLCNSSGSTGAISIRTDPRDTSAVTINISDTHIGTTGAPGTLRPLLLTVNNSTTSTINIGKGNTYLDTGHRSAPSGGTITINDSGALPNTGTMGDRYNQGTLKVRYASAGSTSPQLIIESLSSSSSRQPQIVTRSANLDGTTPSSINPTYTPVAVTSAGYILGEWIAQTCQPNGAWATSCRIMAVQPAVSGNGDTPGQWLFQTCPDGSSTLVTNFTINADGNCDFSGATTMAGLTSTGIVDLTGAVLSGATPLVFEGATANAYETSFAITDPTADRTITFKDASGTVAFLTDIPAAFDPASPGAIGGTTPAAITGTTVTATTQVGCEAYHNAAITLAPYTNVPIPFNSETSDVGGCHDTATNNTRFIATVAGTYIFCVTVPINDDMDGYSFYCFIAKNAAGSPGTTHPQYGASTCAGKPIGAFLSSTWVMSLAANDYLEFFINNDTGPDTLNANARDYPRASFKRLY